MKPLGRQSIVIESNSRSIGLVFTFHSPLTTAHGNAPGTHYAGQSINISQSVA